jgi:FAD/FMN-containing dehydrogenase
MRPVSSWGGLSSNLHTVIELRDPCGTQKAIVTNTGGLAYGNGRSYGDVCLNPEGVLWHTLGLNHFIYFDPESGRLICEAGVLLRDIQQLFIPRGWILPVTPGTQFITVGGAIANDVHGKNHHSSGSFGNHVLRIRLLRTNGDVIECSPQKNTDWFAATVGGLGLTGFITEVDIQMKPVPSPWLEAETLSFNSLDAFFRLADNSAADWEHTVSWVDTLSKSSGRGLFIRANPTHTGSGKKPKKRTFTIPFVPPVSLVNTLTLLPLNAAHYYMNKWRPSRTIQHYEPFFYPLDNIDKWNRLYGSKGFFQYQCVLPRETGNDALSALLAEIKESRAGSFLSVLKTFGDRKSLGMLSFPQPGVTLALDFPNKEGWSLRLFDRLDAIVKEARGRLYLAKDARMPRELFESNYPQLQTFMKYRDPGISSAMSRRLMGS